MGSKVTAGVVIPLDVAELIIKVFLPVNERRMRKADLTVVAAVAEFKRCVHARNCDESSDQERAARAARAKEAAFRWPTMADVTVKLRHMPDVQVGASVSLDTGRPVVDFRLEGDDEQSMTPAEARRVAAVLVKAAACCDAKTAAAKSWRSSPVDEELEAHSEGRGEGVGAMARKESTTQRVLHALYAGNSMSADMIGAAVWGTSRTGRVCSSSGGGDYAAQMLLGRMRKRALVRVEHGDGSSMWTITHAGKDLYLYHPERAARAKGEG